MENKEFSKGLVSVIIPLYNAGEYIAETLESVLNQTVDNYEIIVIDDCSTDNSAEIVNTYAVRNEMIIYHKQEKNMGAAVARNTGLDIAKGQYIAFLDSDDVWTVDKLEKQIAFMNSHSEKCGFSYSAYDMIDAKGAPISGKTKIKSKVGFKDLLKKTLISTPTVIIDREICGAVNMPLRRTGQDYAYWLTLLKDNAAYGIDEALVHVRRRGDSLSKNKFQNLVDVWEVQTQLMRVPKISAVWNLFCYILFTVKKRFFS